MKSSVLFVILIAATAVNLVGQTNKTPRFEQFRVAVSKTRAKPPNLKSHKDARLFRTSLRIAAKEGINFAGHFVITYWGCGASCGVGALIDGLTGRVFFPSQLDGVWAEDWGDSKVPFGIRKDSRLLILKGYLPNDYNGQRTTYGLHYYKWTGTELRLVKFVPQDQESDSN